MIENKILHVMGCIHPQVGGPAYSISKLAQNSNSLGFESTLYSFKYPFDDSEVIVKGIQKRQTPFGFFSKHFGAWNPAGFRDLLDFSKSYSIIHSHGLWIFANAYAAQAAKKNKKKLLISPRGMLDPWTLLRHRLLKKIIWAMWQKKALSEADCIHATSMLEYEQIRDMGICTPVAVIPNGFDFEKIEKHKKDEVLKSNDKRRFLFLSRIDPKKGIEELIETWLELSPQFCDWQLVIAGDGDKSFVARLKKKTEVLEASGQVKWVGFAEEAAKVKLFQNAELFVLPSHSENFGNAILESLAWGVPVLTTDRTPWAMLSDIQAGWCIRDDMGVLKKTLRQALEESSDSLKNKGKLGREYVRNVFSWQKVSVEMVDVYMWLLNRGSRPDCVRMK